MVENDRFDSLFRTLGAGATRRGALGLLAGIAGLGVGEIAAKRRTNKAKRRKANGKAKDRVRTEKAAKGGKVTLCHHDGKDRVRAITVAESAVAAHLKHGDFVRDQCCADGDCPDGQGCDQGRCATVREVCLDGCGFDSLGAALDAAEDGDIIRLGPGHYRTLPLFCNSREVTIVGAGSGDDPATNTIVDAEQSGRVLFIGPRADVELRDLKITGGRVEAVTNGFNGGGILVAGKLRLIGVDVADNHAAHNGGGIGDALLPGTEPSITLRNTTVRRNTVGDRGGGIMFLRELLLQDGSVVEDNQALGNEGPPPPHVPPGFPEPPDPVYGFGGGIYAGNLTLQDGSIVRNNSAAHAGGGIVNQGSATVKAGARVTGNTAGESGGGIFDFPDFGLTVIEVGAVVTSNSPDDCEPDIGSCT